MLTLNKLIIFKNNIISSIPKTPQTTATTSAVKVTTTTTTQIENGCGTLVAR
jgi:hypothetical protein